MSLQKKVALTRPPAHSSAWAGPGGAGRSPLVTLLPPPPAGLPLLPAAPSRLSCPNRAALPRPAARGREASGLLRRLRKDCTLKIGRCCLESQQLARASNIGTRPQPCDGDCGTRAASAGLRGPAPLE